MKVIFKKLNEEVILPTYGSANAAGADVYAPTDMTLEPGVEYMYPLGFATAIPEGYFALLLPRSSTGCKGLEFRNTAGVIDADYRGEWHAPVMTRTELSFKEGDRICQAIFLPVLQAEVVEGELPATERGEGGFGSTGE